MDFSDSHGRVTTLAPAVQLLPHAQEEKEFPEKETPRSRSRTVSGFGTRPAM